MTTTINRMVDAEKMTNLAIETATLLRSGKITPAVANSLLSTARTTYQGIKLERLLLLDMKRVGMTSRRLLPAARRAR